MAGLSTNKRTKTLSSRGSYSSPSPALLPGLTACYSGIVAGNFSDEEKRFVRLTLGHVEDFDGGHGGAVGAAHDDEVVAVTAARRQDSGATVTYSECNKNFFCHFLMIFCNNLMHFLCQE